MLIPCPFVYLPSALFRSHVIYQDVVHLILYVSFVVWAFDHYDSLHEQQCAIVIYVFSGLRSGYRVSDLA